MIVILPGHELFVYLNKEKTLSVIESPSNLNLNDAATKEGC